jgi:hypothetical protein
LIIATYTESKKPSQSQSTNNYTRSNSIFSDTPQLAAANFIPVTEDVIVKNGRVANVLVYVNSSDFDKYSFEPPTSPVMIEHQGCQIMPRVLGIQIEQSLLVFNNSQTTHNTNVQAVTNRPWSKTQAGGAPPIESRFSSTERLIIIKDNQHPWEKAYMSVFAHPFFYVTERDGCYTISGLLPCRYILVAWHEKFGEKRVEITVAAKESKKVDITFTLEK